MLVAQGGKSVVGTDEKIVAGDARRVIERRPVRLHLQRIGFPKILLLSAPSDNAEIRLAGILLAIGAALCYSFYLVIVNRSKRIKKVSEQTLTLYTLITGAVLFAVILGVFEPLTAILIGTLFFSEPLTFKMALGIAICVAAVVFMILKPGKKKN